MKNKADINILAKKVWERAVIENNRLILDNIKVADIAEYLHNSRCKNVNNATIAIQGIIIRNLEFKAIQARKNAI